MSKTENIKQNYISKVHLKGYKSIQDVEIDLLPGMNIIIGPNGSGKTNFLEYIDRAVKSSLLDVSTDTFGRLHFVLEGENYFYESKFEEVEHNNPKDIVPYMREFKSTFYGPNSIPNFKYLAQHFWKSSIFFQKIAFKIYDNILGVNSISDLKFHLGDNKEVSHIFSDVTPFDSIFNLFLKEEVRKLLQKLINDDKNSSAEIAKLIVEKFSINEIAKNLNRFTPIEALRLSDNLRVDRLYNKSIFVGNLSFEYFINNRWLPWKHLSDGTQRLFYIISEITCGDKGFCLIDEPELGLHPDQLHSLMQFLKEQAETKQIILTTHSPQVLNTLKVEDEELNRLIVSRIGENGTEMVKLSDEEKQWAKDALEEGLSLADYWVYSGIEAEKLP